MCGPVKISVHRDESARNGGAGFTICNRSRQGARGGRSTLRKLETPDSCLPAHGARRLTSEGVVLLRVPEGAIIRGIDGQHAVVTPSITCASLSARAINDGSLALEETPGWIGRQTTRIPNTRKHVAT